MEHWFHHKSLRCYFTSPFKNTIYSCGNITGLFSTDLMPFHAYPATTCRIHSARLPHMNERELTLVAKQNWGATGATQSWRAYTLGPVCLSQNHNHRTRSSVPVIFLANLKRGGNMLIILDHLHHTHISRHIQSLLRFFHLCPKLTHE